jgi:PilZ domain-containing protein
MIPNMKIEHRLSQRIPFKEPIKYGLDDNPTVSAYTCDISRSGIGIKASKVFPPESEIVVDMYIGDEVIRVEGIVARVTPILSGMTSIIGLNISGRTDRVKRIFMQRLNKQKHMDETTE